MIFKRAVQRYSKSPEPETPYQRAGRLWDDRIGSARVQARNWRVMAFGCLSLAAAAGAALAWQSLQSRVVPYVVEVDRLGEARAVKAADTAFTPSDAQIAWHLAHFIRDVRAVSLDPVMMRDSWLEAYAYTTERGSRFLGDYARSAKPFERLGERATSVQVTSVVRASDTSYQVKWTETAFERGVPAGRSNWTAILAVLTKPPADADMLRRNPLGIYVDAIDWSRELDVPARPPDQPMPTSSPSPVGTVPPNLEENQL
ncbi:conjugal transfer protein TrbF [Sphingomonas sp.]|uniref:conjugal transfer protein TrbF n=1 Tax=Sphingomonas sp. TaxID=28214 RepID=UPI0025F38634|nr:conjugal transfer protein TrbF [Sphingomonas sp.]